MTSAQKTRRQLALELAEARERHQRLLEKAEKAHRKFEKRSNKLQKIEAKLAELERRLPAPDGDSGGRRGGGSLRRVPLVFNPKSGGAGQGSTPLESVVLALRNHGFEPDVTLKTSGKAVRELARRAADAGEKLIIAAAGDGTIEDIASQLVGSKTTMGIIPTGTMNNLARCLGVPIDIEQAAMLIEFDTRRMIDIGRVRVNEKPALEYFLETAGLGLTAIVVPAGQAAEKGRWRLLPNAIRKLFDSKPHPIAIELDDGQVIAANAEVVTVSNAPMMGKNIMLAPDAKMDDGLLDVAIYDGMNKADLLAYFVAASNGNRVENPKIRIIRARRIHIKSDEPIEAHSDKDDVEPRRILEIEVIPGALSMIVGKGIALTLPAEAVPAVPPLSGPQE